jgi:hypothetical protein
MHPLISILYFLSFRTTSNSRLVVESTSALFSVYWVFNVEVIKKMGVKSINAVLASAVCYKKLNTQFDYYIP